MAKRYRAEYRVSGITVRPAVMNDLETQGLIGRQEAEMTKCEEMSRPGEQLV